MGRIVLGKGHMALLPANAAYRFSSATPGVILLQTILANGACTKVNVEMMTRQMPSAVSSGRMPLWR